jgi:hypothetical protein
VKNKGVVLEINKTTETEHADKYTRKETTKITKENGGKNTIGNMQCDHVKKERQKKAAKQNPSRI